MQFQEKVKNASQCVQKKLGRVQPGCLGIVLGTGLGESFAAELGGRGMDYADIPGFPVSTAPGHRGRLHMARIGETPAMVLAGRVHLYEGHSARDVCFGVRLLGELGVRTLILTNAAGALNPLFGVGGLMLIADHVNLTGQSPLTGPNVDAWGERFPDMSLAWDRELADLAMEAAASLGLRLERGVYAQVPGPEMETPAQTRMLRALGADAVGMSTAMEAVAARHMGMRLLGVSCLTNMNLPDCMAPVSSEQVIARAEKSAGDLGRLLRRTSKLLRPTY